MKTFATFLSAFLAVSAASASDAPNERRLKDIGAIPTRALQRMISPKFYRSLVISPVEGWIVVRGQLSGTKMVGARIIHSELGGEFDSLALKLADEVKIQGNNTIGTQVNKSVLLQLLIYKIADGTMALSFANLDGAGNNQLSNWGCAKLAVLHPDGTWVNIKGPPGLEGKGMMVRANDSSQNFELALKTEKIPGKP